MFLLLFSTPNRISVPPNLKVTGVQSVARIGDSLTPPDIQTAFRFLSAAAIALSRAAGPLQSARIFRPRPADMQRQDQHAVIAETGIARHHRITTAD
jgi:hypothetical protein